ncbi:hypothetical protein BZA70DRAFT_269749 [Myxozyma melibiosi]|uniref:Ribosomal protein L22 n=1 Tax=Myxozyma melibiosi TaxID=54550 RepID=A0ABR1EZ43_9ASCO
MEFDLIDLSMQKKDDAKPGEETKTEEDRELEELNRSLDQYTAGQEGKPDATAESAEKAKIPPEEDPELLAITKPTPKKAIDVLLSPLQKAVYLRQTTGVDDPLITGKKYKFKVNRRLQELLEPSLWIKSHTLSGSVKKVTPLLRSLRKMTVTRAIAHCHFNVKHEAKHLETLLYRALDEAKALGMSTKGLYIAQVWSGKEPKPDMAARSRIDYKGRGRAGTLLRKEHHVQMIIKTPVTLERIATEKKKKMMGKKPWNTLRDKPFYDKRGQEYNW